jgi:hypothetical protein
VVSMAPRAGAADAASFSSFENPASEAAEAAADAADGDVSPTSRSEDSPRSPVVDEFGRFDDECVAKSAAFRLCRACNFLRASMLTMRVVACRTITTQKAPFWAPRQHPVRRLALPLPASACLCLPQVSALVLSAAV